MKKLAGERDNGFFFLQEASCGKKLTARFIETLRVLKWARAERKNFEESMHVLFAQMIWLIAVAHL